MNKTLLSIVIGSALTTVGYVNAAPEHGAMNGTDSTEHHNEMMHSDAHNTMQKQHNSMAGMDHGT